jgi:hypothetical protein
MDRILNELLHLKLENEALKKQLNVFAVKEDEALSAGRSFEPALARLMQTLIAVTRSGTQRIDYVYVSKADFEELLPEVARYGTDYAVAEGKRLLRFWGPAGEVMVREEPYLPPRCMYAAQPPFVMNPKYETFAVTHRAGARLTQLTFRRDRGQTASIEFPESYEAETLTRSTEEQHTWQQ